MIHQAYAPFLIPIVALIGAFAIGIVAMVLKNQARERQHRERMFMAEKGIEIPRELYEVPETKAAKPNGFRAGRAWLMIFGSILIFIGIGVMIAVGLRDGFYEGVMGIIPLLIGIGLLVSERMIARFALKSNEE